MVKLSVIYVMVIFISTSCMANSFKHIFKYRKYVYKVHPLVFIAENGKKTLLKQNQLDNNGIPSLNNNQQVLLICTGHNNLIATSSKDRTVNIMKHKFEDFEWIRLYVFPENGIFEKSKIEEARCLSPFLASVTSTDQTCANGKGIYVDVFFRINPSETECVYSICFDQTKTMSPLYTVHPLFGTRLLFPEDEKLGAFPFNRATKNVMRLKTPSSPYQAKHQDLIFRGMFHSTQSKRYLRLKDVNGHLYISAPLTPPGDFYYISMKTATFIFENTVPIFSTIYYGNWYIVQVLGRIFALQSESKTIAVISGSFGVLELPDTDKEMKPIYLDELNNGEKYRPMPKYVYKIFVDTEKKSGVAFVTSNNPFFETRDFPCKSVDEKFSHGADFFRSNLRSGITLCCRIQDLMEVVTGLPSMDLRGGILSLNRFDIDVPWNHLRPKEVKRILV